MVKTKTLLAALLAAVFLGSTAFAAGIWTSVRSKNFLLVGDADEKEIRAAAFRLEQFREIFSRLFPNLKVPAGTQTNVIVFRNAESYRPFKPKKSDGGADEIVRGFFAAGEDVNYITLSLGERADPFGTAFHEYVHLVLAANFERSAIPAWVDEGLAEYFRTLRADGGRLVTVGTPPGDRLRLLGKNAWVPIDTLIETDGESLRGASDEQRNLFYAQSWALVHYLMQGGNASPADGLARFISLLQSREAPEQAFRTAFQIDPAEAEKALQAYCAQPNLPSTTIALSTGFAFDPETSSSPISEPEATAYLGDLLLHTGDLSGAETLLRKALSADAKPAMVNGSLGTLMLRRGRFAEARKYLERAIGTEKPDHYVLFNYAYALSRESADAEGRITGFPAETEKQMRDALRRSIALEPNFSESYRLLGFLEFVKGGDLDEAVSLLKQGLRVRPGDENISILLARVLLRQEKVSEAKAIAGRIRRSSQDSKLLSEADEVLRTIDELAAVRTALINSNDEALLARFGLLLVKRSAVTEADIARFDEDRRINNLNRILGRPQPGEQRIIGYIDRIACGDEGIRYGVRTPSGRMNLFSGDFAGIRMAVLTEGESAFKLDCGMRFDRQLTVLTYYPASGANTSSGELKGIAFVPDFFRLKTPEELARARFVVVEDDTPRSLRSGRPAKDDLPK